MVQDNFHTSRKITDTLPEMDHLVCDDHVEDNLEEVYLVLKDITLRYDLSEFWGPIIQLSETIVELVSDSYGVAMQYIDTECWKNACKLQHGIDFKKTYPPVIEFVYWRILLTMVALLT